MEKILENFLQKISSNKYWELLRYWDQDIDILAYDYNKIKDFFTLQWCVCFFDDNYKLKFYYFVNTKRYTIDIIVDLHYISNRFFNTFTLNDTDIQNQEQEFNVIRYLTFFRQDKVSYCQKHYALLNNDINSFLSENVFKNQFKCKQEIKNYLAKKPISLWKHLRLQYFLLYYVYKCYFAAKLIMKRLLSNNTYAILWYDWSWKTTINEILTDNFGVPSFYMGFKRYSDRYYYKFLDGNLLLKLIRLIFVAIDFWFLYIRIFYAKIRYEFVFFDRHPKCEIYPHSSIAQKAVTILFFLYPSPKKNIILYNSPDVILSRKKERTHEEIIELNKYIFEVLQKNKKNIIIKNDNIDETLNCILEELY